MQDCQWLRPVLVAQIEFREWTPDAHLRHPSFIGLAKWQRRREKLGKNKASVLSATGSTAEFSSVLLPDGDHATLSYASSRASSSVFSTNSLLVSDLNQTLTLVSSESSLSRIFRRGSSGSVAPICRANSSIVFPSAQLFPVQICLSAMFYASVVWTARDARSKIGFNFLFGSTKGRLR